MHYVDDMQSRRASLTLIAVEADLTCLVLSLRNHRLNVNTPENHDDVRRVVDSTDIVDEILAQRESRRQEKKRLSRRCTPNKAAKPEATFRGLGCRGKSDKKHRRFENGMSCLS